LLFAKDLYVDKLLFERLVIHFISKVSN